MFIFGCLFFVLTSTLAVSSLRQVIHLDLIILTKCLSKHIVTKNIVKVLKDLSHGALYYVAIYVKL